MPGPSAGKTYNIYDKNIRNTYIKTVPSRIVAWGTKPINGVDNVSLPSNVKAYNANIVSICATSYAIAALDTSGNVTVWGNLSCGGDASNNFNTNKPDTNSLSNITRIYANDYAFLAIDTTGYLYGWGGGTNGEPKYGVNLPSQLSGKTIVDVYATSEDFLALDSDGTAYMLGTNIPTLTTSSNIIKVVSNDGGFAMIDKFGNGYIYGYLYTSGDKPTLINIVKVIANTGAYAFLDNGGEVHVWGNSINGGTFTSLTGVVDIFSNNYVFGALKTDGSVYTWGNTDYGGNPTIPAVPAIVTENNGANLTNIIDIKATTGAFCALNVSGNISIWGSAEYGGAIGGTYNLKKISTGNDISIYGGFGTGTSQFDQSSVIFTSIYSSNNTFVALDSDGNTYIWGGGVGVGSNFNTFTKIYQYYQGFLGLKSNGSILQAGLGDINIINGLNFESINESETYSSVENIVMLKTVYYLSTGASQVFAFIPVSGDPVNISSNPSYYTQNDLYYLSSEPRNYTKLTSTDTITYSITNNSKNDYSIFQNLSNWFNLIPITWYDDVSGTIFFRRDVTYMLDAYTNTSNNVIILNMNDDEVLSINGYGTKYIKTKDKLYILSDGTYTETPSFIFNDLTYNVLVGDYGIVLYDSTLYCFLKGTMIKTINGWKKVEKLKKTDILLSGDKKINIKEIKIIMSDNYDQRPYVIKRNQFGYNYPNENLYLSAGHAFKINGKYYHPFHETKKNITKSILKPPYVYYHIITEDYYNDVIIANNIECESCNINNINYKWECAESECKLIKL